VSVQTEQRLRKLRVELQGIDHKRLLLQLESLNDRERRLKVRVILYLREIDRRRLHLERGYSSMFSFCVNHLKYFESTAVRRVKAELKVNKNSSKTGRKLTANAEGPDSVLEEKYRLEFMVAAGTMDKINRAKNLLSTKYPGGVWLEALFDELLHSFLMNNDPERSETGRGDIKIDKAKHTRYIPRKLRDHVYRRDVGRCTFVGRKGKRCSSRWDLQIDHIVPFGKGGDNSPENLRFLCGRHNRLMAEREYGRKHMKSSCRGDVGSIPGN